MSARLSVLFSPGSVASRGLLAAALVSVFVASVLDPGGTPAVGVNDKLQHLFAFAVLGFLARRAMPRQDRWRVILPLMLGYGLLVECVQWFMPWREFSLLDLLADLVGLLIALVPGASAASRRRPAAP